jgi:predicted metal-dependent HD superfamily phosphohydrolase
MAMKISTHTQVLLRPENLDPQIITDLDLDPLGTDVGFEVDRGQLRTLDANVAPVEVASGTHDIINDLLQANRTSTDLEMLQQRATD